MIYIRTCAYNAAKTLKRTIESILQQTYQDFEYHILDNGSTDRTGNIIREYAKQDKRIVPYFNKVNRAFQENPDFWNISRRIPEGDYFCILDADDAYAPTFFQEMLNFMLTNQLEIAACGTVFLDGASGQETGRNVLRNSVVIRSAQEMNTYFPTIHWNLRQVWGKLYSSRAAAARYEIELPDWFPKAYGGDTLSVMQCVRAVKQFGVYAKALHYYTISVKSVSHQWVLGREESDRILHEKALDFLMDCCGNVSRRNLCFLYSVYFHAVLDTLRLLKNSILLPEDKLAYLKKILLYPVTEEMFSAELSLTGVKKEQQQDLLYNILGWVVSQAKSYNQKHAILLVEIFARFNPDFERMISTDTVLWYLRKTPQTVLALAERDYLKAAEVLAEMLEKDCTKIFPVVLAQTLAALLQNQETYIFYSKLLLKMQFQAGLREQAKAGLDEWEQILPGDMDLAKLRNMLSK